LNMREEGKATRVSIFGGEYSIRGEADPDYIRTVANYVDGKMREIDGELKVPSVSKVAILASLNIADELFKEKLEKEKVVSEIGQRAARMMALLENSLEGE
jgi:cell division protein ZapA